MYYLGKLFGHGFSLLFLISLFKSGGQSFKVFDPQPHVLLQVEHRNVVLLILLVLVMPLDPLDALHILVEEDVGLLLVSQIAFYKRRLEQFLAGAGKM